MGSQERIEDIFAYLQGKDVKSQTSPLSSAGEAC